MIKETIQAGREETRKIVEQHHCRYCDNWQPDTGDDRLDCRLDIEEAVELHTKQQIALLEAVKSYVGRISEPLPSANDHKEYNRGVRVGVELARNGIIKHLTQSIKELE